jgi:DNA-binding NtrC family response regulator
VGGIADVTVDVRIIAATNQDLLKLIEDGRFREDLYFRLNVLSIKIPPLRERREDIPLLVEHFLKKFSDGKKRITDEAMRMLQNYRWKGNVRELENIIERVVLLSEGEIIDVRDLPEEIRNSSGHDSITIPPGGIDLERLIMDTEKAYLIKALEKANGVKTEAARLLNLSFRSFRHKLKKYRINQITHYSA